MPDWRIWLSAFKLLSGLGRFRESCEPIGKCRSRLFSSSSENRFSSTTNFLSMALTWSGITPSNISRIMSDGSPPTTWKGFFNSNACTMQLRNSEEKNKSSTHQILLFTMKILTYQFYEMLLSTPVGLLLQSRHNITPAELPCYGLKRIDVVLH